MATAADTLDIEAPRRERLLGRLRDRVAASDPAFSRLRLASRALLSLLLSGVVLAGVTFALHPLPITAYGMAVVVSFVGAMAVTDKTGPQQALTRFYGLLVAIAMVFFAGLLAPIPWVADIAFLAVVFGAVYVRKFGMRWFAIGMLAFMGYFMGDYLRPQPGDIGWIAVASAIAFAITHAVTMYMLSSDPERDFRRALVTIDRRINLILRHLLQTRRDGIANDEERRPLQHHLSLLRDTIMMAEGFIPQGEEGSLAAAGAASDLAVALFELQLLVERMVRASYIRLPPRDLLTAVLYRDRSAVDASLARLRDAPEEEEVAARLLARLDQARSRLDTTLGRRPSPAFAPIKGKPVASPAPPAAGNAAASRIPVALHLPIQVTLACGIAMAAGLLLSPVRWYWAVLTAFIVFNNAKSRADTAFRSLQRSGGTFAGLIGGTIVATLLHDQMVISAIGVPVLFFIAFYFLQVSYSLMIFFVTIALALLYGVMGTFTPDLLVLRLEETVVGCLAGTLVAFFVFPTSASSTVASVLEKYLDALGELVAAAGRRAHGEPEPQHLLARSRILDRSYTELANAVRPLGGPWNAVTRFGEVRERLLLLTGCAHWGRVLARSLRPGEPLSATRLERIDLLAAELKARIGRARSLKESFFERPEVADGAVTAATPRPPLPITEAEDPVFALEVISALLDRATFDAHSHQS